MFTKNWDVQPEDHSFDEYTEQLEKVSQLMFEWLEAYINKDGGYLKKHGWKKKSFYWTREDISGIHYFRTAIEIQSQEIFEHAKNGRSSFFRRK